MACLELPAVPPAPLSSLSSSSAFLEMSNASPMNARLSPSDRYYDVNSSADEAASRSNGGIISLSTSAATASVASSFTFYDGTPANGSAASDASNSLPLAPLSALRNGGGAAAAPAQTGRFASVRRMADLSLTDWCHLSDHRAVVAEFKMR